MRGPMVSDVEEVARTKQPKKATKKSAAENQSSSNSTPKKSSALKKLDPETSKLLQTIKEKVNKKNFGRKVRDSEIIKKALALLKPEHIEELQESTLTERDRLALAHEDYQKAHGKLTLDQFIGMLLKGEIRAEKQK